MTFVPFFWVKLWWKRPGEGRHRGRLDVLLRDVPIAVRDCIQTTIEGAVAVEHATRADWRDLSTDTSTDDWTPHLRTKVKRKAVFTVEEWLAKLDASRLSDEREFAGDIRRLISKVQKRTISGA